MITDASDKNWTTKEREEFIERAVKIYLKKRKGTLSTFEPLKNVPRFQSEVAESVELINGARRRVHNWQCFFRYF